LPLVRARTTAARVLALAALALLLVSLVCVFVPRRPFPHYLQLTVIPWTLFIGTVTGLACQALPEAPRRRRTAVLGACFLATAGSLVFSRAGLVHPHLGRLASYQAHPAGPVALEIQKYTRPGDALGVWGWPTNYYAETGLRQATRDAHSQAEILAHLTMIISASGTWTISCGTSPPFLPTPSGRGAIRFPAS